MAQITLTLSDEALAMLVASFTGQFGYQPMIAEDTPNPQTAGEFTQEKIISYCRSVIAEYQINQARESVQKTVTDQVAAIPVEIKIG